MSYIDIITTMGFIALAIFLPILLLRARRPIALSYEHKVLQLKL